MSDAYTACLRACSCIALGRLVPVDELLEEVLDVGGFGVEPVDVKCVLHARQTAWLDISNQFVHPGEVPGEVPGTSRVPHVREYMARGHMRTNEATDWMQHTPR